MLCHRTHRHPMDTPAPQNEIVVYQPDGDLRLEVRLEAETVWLNQSKLAELFGVDRTVINRHIHNIFKSGELDSTATCANIAQVQDEGGRLIRRLIPFYNLDHCCPIKTQVTNSPNNSN